VPAAMTKPFADWNISFIQWGITEKEKKNSLAYIELIPHEANIHIHHCRQKYFLCCNITNSSCQVAMV